MQILLRPGLFFLIFLAFPPPSVAACPEGTRNNYKGECVDATLTNQESQTQSTIQPWLEPATDASVVEETVEGGSIEKSSGESGSDSVVIVEEVVAIDKDSSSSTADAELLTDTSVATDLANALLTIQQLREEIRDLLNRVELQRYEVEKLRGRQRDLYDDLDHRLRKQERLALAVPMPAIPAVDSTAILTVVPPTAEPTPIVVGAEQQLPPSDGSSNKGVTEIKVTSEAQDEENPVIAAEGVATVPAPTPMVVVTDERSVPTSDSGATVIAQPRIQVEMQDQDHDTILVAAETVATVSEPTPMMVAGTDFPLPSSDSGAPVVILPEAPAENRDLEIAEPAVVEQIGEEPETKVTTVLVGPSKTEVGESAVEIEAPIALDIQKHQVDIKQDPNVVEEVISVVPADISTEDRSAVQVTAMVTTTVTLGEQDAYDQAFNMLKQSRYEDAAEEFANFLRYYRNSQLTDDAWYWMAEAHYVTRDFDRALIGFNTVVNYFLKSPRIPASRLKIGYIQYEKSNYEESRETLTKLLQDFPAHRVAVSAQARLKKMDRERQ
jgi:tol-pal system protein YbgF